MPADDPIDYQYGKSCLSYCLSLGQNTSYSTLKVGNLSLPNQKYYGGGFETTPAVVNRILVLAGEPDEYAVRNFLTALIGVIVILFTGLIAREISGWRAGFIALWLLFLSPPFVGQALFNSKDIPFAAAFAISIHIAGVLLILYLFVFAAYVLNVRRSLWNHEY